MRTRFGRQTSRNSLVPTTPTAASPRRERAPPTPPSQQGFASGDAEADSASIRLFADAGHSLVLAQSFAKNFGLYGDTWRLVVVASGVRRSQPSPPPPHQRVRAQQQQASGSAPSPSCAPTRPRRLASSLSSRGSFGRCTRARRYTAHSSSPRRAPSFYGNLLPLMATSFLTWRPPSSYGDPLPHMATPGHRPRTRAPTTPRVLVWSPPSLYGRCSATMHYARSTTRSARAWRFESVRCARRCDRSSRPQGPPPPPPGLLCTSATHRNHATLCITTLHR